MRWVRYRDAAGVPALGVLAAGRAHRSRESRVLDLIASGRLAEAGRDALADPVEVIDARDLTLLAPLETPPSVRDFMAFEQHVDGLGALVGVTPRVPDVWFEQPLFYFSNPTAITGPTDDVPVPPGCAVLDFELEVAAVVGPLPDGAPLADLSLADAERCIVGYVLMNDWSARDLQMREMQGPLGPCKGKDAAISLGPWLLTADEVPSLARGTSDVRLEVSVGERYVGGDRLGAMAWSFAEMAAYASRGTRLQPGDLLGSGTCGDGCLAERWGRQGREGTPALQPGEVVRMTAGPLGGLTNRVVAGTPVTTPLTRRRPRAAAGGTIGA